MPAVTDADWYTIQDSAPTTVINVTQLPQTTGGAFPAFLEPGEAYDGTQGPASLSPDGALLAFVATHDEELVGQPDDEVYATPTDGSQRPTLALPITSQSWFDSSTNPELDNAQDLFAVNATEVLFFYGGNASGHTGDQFMDLFHVDLTTGTVTNLTATSGETSAPFTGVGGIHPEGYFPSPSGR